MPLTSKSRLVARFQLLGGIPDNVFNDQDFTIIRIEEYFYVYEDSYQ